MQPSSVLLAATSTVTLSASDFSSENNMTHTAVPDKEINSQTPTSGGCIVPFISFGQAS
ncbi:hypothetical protein PR003_g31645 [Phytophthora rubi]|uniref:Uncharacterized protein n=1 Tax=Phytophthora rubi TaxID=129364 RepID=A0A6A3INM9_9STRA|nr:hypothetical protein PR001_g23770 [Phytophthora rubi]KAE8991487.1 hypothetical protein PR002_g20836 [Phytophthora rubi]KAE9267838.1 hypothetical protein PR003_g31645 [Phytophthora rubi]